MFELLALAMLIIIATLLAWLGLRAWRTKNGFMKWGGASLAVLLSTVASLMSIAANRSMDLRWPALITEPCVEDKILAARAGAAHDSFRLCTEDLEPATYVTPGRQAAGLHAMEAGVQQ